MKTKIQVGRYIGPLGAIALLAYVLHIGGNANILVGVVVSLLAVMFIFINEALYDGEDEMPPPVCIDYDKRDAPVTAHEVVALDFLARHDQLPANPLTPEQLRAALRGLSPALRDKLRAKLQRSPDEGAGILAALD